MVVRVESGEQEKRLGGIEEAQASLRRSIEQSKALTAKTQRLIEQHRQEPRAG